MRNCLRSMVRIMNAKSAYTESYNLSVQQSFTPTISFTLGYQGNVSRHLRVSYGANQYPGVIPYGANSQLYQPFYDFGNIVQVINEGDADYNSLQAKLDKRFSHGLSFLAGYAWSHSLDDAVQPIQGTDGGEAGNPAFLGLKFQYGASNIDVRNRFTFAPQYELPFGKGKAFLNHGGVIERSDRRLEGDRDLPGADRHTHRSAATLSVSVTRSLPAARPILSLSRTRTAHRKPGR